MNIVQKVLSNFREKGLSSVLMLPRFSQGEWSESKYLGTYDRSVYVFACVKKIAEKIGNINFILYRVKNIKGDLEQINYHPYLNLLNNPNGHQTKNKVFQLKQINEELTGDAYLRKIIVGGSVKELWHLRPDWVKVIPDERNYIKEFIYEIPGAKYKTYRFDPEEIIHFAQPSPIKEFIDRTGQTPIRPAQNRIDTEEFATRFNRDFFLNNARPDSVLKTEQHLSKERIQEMKDEWDKNYKGVGKNSKTAVLYGGLGFEQIAVNQKDMDYLNGLKLTRDDILTIFGVPKPIISITDDVNRANAETAIRIFLSETIKPKMESLVETLNQFLTPYFGDDLILDCEDPSPEDREQVLKEYENGSNYGWLTQNEIREREGLPQIINGDQPLVDKKLDIINLSGFIPKKKTVLLGVPIGKEIQGYEEVFNGRKDLYNRFRKEKLMIQVEKEMKEKKKKEKQLSAKKRKEIEERREKIWKSYIADLNKNKVIIKKELETYFNKQEKKILGTFKKSYKTLKARKNYIKKQLDDFEWDKEVEELTGILTFSGEKVSKITGKVEMAKLTKKRRYVLTGEIKHWINNRSKISASLINETTRKKLIRQLDKALLEGETIDQIKDRVKETFKIRKDAEAMRIARTETAAIMNYSTLETYKQSDVVEMKEWIATMDDRVRPEHAAADGQKRKLNEPFNVGGNLLDEPNEINCRCCIAPHIEIK